MVHFFFDIKCHLGELPPWTSGKGSRGLRVTSYFSPCAREPLSQRSIPHCHPHPRPIGSGHCCSGTLGVCLPTSWVRHSWQGKPGSTLLGSLVGRSPESNKKSNDRQQHYQTTNPSQPPTPSGDKCVGVSLRCLHRDSSLDEPRTH